MTWKRVEPMEERCRFVLLAREPRANIAALCREFVTVHGYFERIRQRAQHHNVLVQSIC